MGGVQALQGAVHLLPSEQEVADVQWLDLSSPLLFSDYTLSRTHASRFLVLLPFSTTKGMSACIIGYVNLQTHIQMSLRSQQLYLHRPISDLEGQKIV